jgi:protoheme IX farnesyltransferase
MTLVKPSITLMVVITAAGGLVLSRRIVPRSEVLPVATILSTLSGCALLVAGANVLNMYLERNVDRRMIRTKDRPLPAGRMSPPIALWFGVVLSAVAIPVLAFGANALTTLLAIFAHVLYVMAYTPLKQRSSYALLVGAIPGAIPPLLGWTAGTGRVTRHTIVRWTFALVVASLLVVPLGVAHLRLSRRGHGTRRVLLHKGLRRPSCGERASLVEVTVRELARLYCAPVRSAGGGSMNTVTCCKTRG